MNFVRFIESAIGVRPGTVPARIARLANSFILLYLAAAVGYGLYLLTSHSSVARTWAVGIGVAGAFGMLAAIEKVGRLTRTARFAGSVDSQADVEARRLAQLRRQAEVEVAELRAARAAESRRSGSQGDSVSAELEARLAALEEENRTLRGQRAADASAELGIAFQEAASRYRRSANFWLFGLLIAVSLLAAASFYWVLERRIEKNATPAQIATAIAAGAVMLGVPAYLVRVAANQFRALQRLTVVAEGKAAILRAFSDIVNIHQDPAQVATLTEKVASSVFTVADPGSMDSAESVNVLQAALGEALGRVK